MQLKSLIVEVFDPLALSTLFQPIFELRDARLDTHAYECLTRGPVGTNLESATVLFEYVRRKAREREFDRICIANALRIAAGCDVVSRLSLNVHASTLGGEEGFAEYLLAEAAARGLAADRLIVEIVEHSTYWDPCTFLASVALLRDHGTRIALDDIGVGYSNYQMILDTHADYLKVDRYLVDNCHADPRKQIVIRSIVKMAADLGSCVVAEGVASSQDLACLQDIGVELFQGFALSRPLCGIDLPAGGHRLLLREVLPGADS